MEDQEIRYLGDVQRLTLKPGDTLVLSCAEPISDETAERLTQYLVAKFGPEQRVLVMGDGLKVGVLSPD